MWLYTLFFNSKRHNFYWFDFFHLGHKSPLRALLTVPISANLSAALLEGAVQSVLVWLWVSERWICFSGVCCVRGCVRDVFSTAGWPLCLQTNPYKSHGQSPLVSPLTVPAPQKKRRIHVCVTCECVRVSWREERGEWRRGRNKTGAQIAFSIISNFTHNCLRTPN